jgi:LysM repeat protein
MADSGSGQQVAEGGMRFYKRNVDAMSFRSSSVAGVSPRGSAAVSGGTINTGSAASDVLSELNLITAPADAEPELALAGEARQWSQALRLQRSAISAEPNSAAILVSRGSLDENLRVILLEQPKLVETITKDNPNNPSQPFSNVQFTEQYDRLEALLDAKTSRGVHIISSGSPQQLRPQQATQSPAESTLAWSNERVIRAASKYMGYANGATNPASANENVLRPTSLGSTGTSNNRINFSVVGFASNPNPNDGKNSTIAAFATNNRTVGSIRVPDLIAGKKPTLQDIATQYGTTVEQLMQVNNLPSSDLDLAGISLTVPADLLTVDYHVVEKALPGETQATPRSLAKRFGVNAAWLMDLNGWVDSEQTLEAGQKVQVPGLAKSCATQPNAPGCRNSVLPPAKPLAPELETADYGAYTTTEVTYDCAGNLRSFCSRFIKPLR